MKRTPPTLLYLTIFNPTLPPTGLPFEGDEDAEEQAHILFYTSRERAVSRDRMLRQVGLAKAVINFSELFNGDETCDNVHAQSRRMVMVSPEVNFWIYATIELSNTPRAPVEPAKDKNKGKEKESGKPNEKKKRKEQEEAKDTPIPCDFHDGSIHNLAIRANLLWGYEQFKLTHGSFASILATLGREALELQLERFFTVWAWSWDLEEGHDFGRHFGVPLHPHHRLLTPILDEFSSQLPDEGILLVASSCHIIPSTRFSAASYPPVLSKHLLSQSCRSTNCLDQSPGSPAMTSPASAGHVAAGQGNLLRMPAMTLGLPAMHIGTTVRKMDLKWSWPEYLTFGRGSGKNTEIPKTKREPTQKESRNEIEVGDEQLREVVVDKNALDDAISSHNSISLSMGNNPQSVLRPVLLNAGDVHNDCSDTASKSSLVEGEVPPQSPADPVDANPASALVSDDDLPTDTTSSSSSIQRKEDSPEPHMTIPEFSTMPIYLADGHDATATRKRNVFYITKDQLTVFLIGMDSEGTEEALVQPTLALSDKIQSIIVEEAKHNAPDTVSSATKILEADDKYMITTERFMSASPGFTSKSEHLYNAQQLLQKGFDVCEVFSRGQNPQHWYILRRGLGLDEKGMVIEGDVYMEVSRKETSLTDVDNDVSSLVKKIVG